MEAAQGVRTFKTPNSVLCSTTVIAMELPQAGSSQRLPYASLIPPAPIFPFLLPPAPQSHPTPLPRGKRVKLLSRRNLVAEANDLSDEEQEVDEAVSAGVSGISY